MDRLVVGDLPLISNVFYVPSSTVETDVTLRDGRVVTVPGTPTDPTTITLTITLPSGVLAGTYTYLAGTVTKFATGVFDKQDYATTVEGTHTYKWVGTGSAADIQDGSFQVLAAQTNTLYCGLEELKSLVSIDDDDDDLPLETALLAACRTIDSATGRRYYPDATATARVFKAGNPSRIWLNADFYTITGLIVATDEGADGTFETTWASTDYQLEPLNGIVDGASGWPYDRITAVGNYRWPTACTDRALVQITAKWGWSAPPEPIRQAAKLLAKDLWKNKDTVGGVQGFDQFGAVRVRQDPFIAMLLAPYTRIGLA